MPQDFSKVVAEITTEAGTSSVPLTWYGESLWRLTGDDPSGITAVRICAMDAAGNENCSAEVEVQNDGTCDRCDGGGGPNSGGDSGGCSASGGRAGWIAMALVMIIAIRRRRKAKFFGLFE